MTLEEINSERKSLNDQLKSLKTQRDAKALALQQRKEAFSSDRFLGDLYKIDPATASFFADKMAKDRQLDINANKLYSGTYTPEQKSIVDAKQQNRIRMGEVLSTINTLKAKGAAETEIIKWQSQYDALVANDERLNTQLANLQTPGYVASSTVLPTPKPVGVDEILEMSASENSTAYINFRKELMKNKYSLDNIPSIAVIVDTAKKWKNPDDPTKKYNITENVAEKIKNEMVEDANRRMDNTNKQQQFAAAAAAEMQKEYENWIKNNLPGVEKDRDKLADARTKIVNALRLKQDIPSAGAYLAMKNQLGDAINGGDFAGLAGFTGFEGFKAKFAEFAGNTTLDDAKSKILVTAAVDSFNSGVNDFNERIKNADKDNQDFVNTAFRAYKIDTVQMPNVGGNNTAGNSKIKIIGWGKN